MTDLRGRPVAARDGRVGWLSDLYFDTRCWAIRYLVVETAEWLAAGEALIPPASVIESAGEAQVISTSLRRAAIEAAAVLHGARRAVREPRLRSMLQLLGSGIEGPDGTIGVMEDFLVDDEGWVICDLLVDARQWLSARILLPPHAVRDVDPQNGAVRVPFTRAELELLHRSYLRRGRAREGPRAATGNQGGSCET